MGNWKQLSPSLCHDISLGRVYGISDIGTVRPSNQDNFFIDTGLGLVVLADGMGGHADGAVASVAAIKALRGFVERAVADAESDDSEPGDDALLLKRAIAFANQQLFQANLEQGHAEGMGMGTTLTGLWRRGASGPAVFFHVGDSRLYRYRDGQLTQLTHDQTLYQQALDAGASAPLPPRNLLLQALGPSATVQPELQQLRLRPADLYLLCSDGLYAAAPPGAIETILAQAQADGGDRLGQGCEQLVAMAKNAGSRDNITAVLLAV